MKKGALVLGIVLMATTVGENVWAKAQTGIGIIAGFSATTLTSGPLEIDTSGPGYGFDFQLAPSDNFSMNLFYYFSREEGSFAFPPVSSASTPFAAEHEFRSGGLQFRGWSENLFLGAFFAHYTLDFTFTSNEGAISGEGTEKGWGIGVVTGWEGDSGLFIAGQYEIASLEGDDIFTPRLLIGFRFKGD